MQLLQINPCLLQINQVILQTMGRLLQTKRRILQTNKHFPQTMQAHTNKTRPIRMESGGFLDLFDYTETNGGMYIVIGHIFL